MRCAMLVVALSAVPATAQAQMCLGQTSHAQGAVKASAGLEVGGNDETAFWGGAGIGRPESWFAGATAGVISGNGNSSFGIGVNGGLEFKEPVAGKLELCPLAGIRKQFGDFGFTDFMAAVSAAYPLGSESASTRLMLVGGYQGIYQRYGQGAEEWYGNIDLGIGLLFNSRFSLVPQVRIPFRFSGGRDPSFILRGSVNLGG